MSSASPSDRGADRRQPAARLPADPPPRGEPVLVHASCVVANRRGLLIVGPSGSGKSALALQLMALGAALVADDRTCLTLPDEGPPVAAAAPAIAGLIEARGLGILVSEPARPCRVAAIVDLATVEGARVPPGRTRRLLGRELCCFHKVVSPHFAAALHVYLHGERR